MKEPSENNSPSPFFKTDGGKTRSNAIEIPAISLPKGGGAIKGIDEKFTVNAVNGTANFSIPLPFSSARGAQPGLFMSYNSGAGNSIFGLGWSMSLGSIKRKTDKALPRYLDELESDVFLFSEAEDLVPAFKKKVDGSFQLDASGEYQIDEITSSDNLFIIRKYRPRIEGAFARIERWTEKTTGIIKWRVISRDNHTTLFGWTKNSILCNPEDPTKIYEWLPEFVYDDRGNCFQYIYKQEDAIGFNSAFMHNNNRWKDGQITYTNLYLEKVFYGNKTPFRQFGDAFPLEKDYLFQTVFDYGVTDIDNDPIDLINPWNFRSDAFSDFKAGFEIRTTRLCNRVLLFHVFEELALKPDKSDAKTLIRSINFEFDTSTEQDFTFLKSITSYGYIKKPNGGYSYKTLPSMQFEYQKHDWNSEVKMISSESLEHAPAGLAAHQYHFTDLFNEGLSGIFTEQAGGWYYKHNLGNGKFEPAILVSPKPSFTGTGEQLQWADLDGDGGKQLVSFVAEPRGYFDMSDENEWQALRSFQKLPNIDFNDPNTRMLDLNGDGKPEIVISEDTVFTWYASEGRIGYSAAQKSSKPFDEETGPNIVFADALQTIYLADMSGDGMTDIVRIRNGEVCYWPNLGYGKFGTKIALDNAPVFDQPDAFNPAYLQLADLDGSGTTDIIYLGKNKFTCWKNLSGNRFSTIPFEINVFPEIHSHSKVTVTDLLGNGVACIVWSSPLLKDAHAPLRYIDLMNSKKPHIMVVYKNNMGKEVSMEYTPSTKFYLEDKQKGKPWATKLHFPVQCISKTTIEDKITGHKFVSEYVYHHGYYDHAEREFRGFGMVEQIDAETFEHWVKSGAGNITDNALHQEPVVSKIWKHTGAYLQNDKILSQFEKDYWYHDWESELKRQGLTVPTIHEEKLPDARLVLADGLDPNLLNLTTQEWREAHRACKGMELRSEVFARDASKFENSNEARIKELTPFTVAAHNCVIELLQPKGKNKHAVFVVKESEAIIYNYERTPEDPRVAHSLNIRLDEYGNVLESASVVYPRVHVDVSLPVETQETQKKTIVIYSQNQFTNDVIDEHIHRLRLPSEVRTFELKNVSKLANIYTLSDFENILDNSKSEFAHYHEINKPIVASKAQKRLIEHIRSTYYSNNLKTSLPPHQLESLAIPFDSYQLAYTKELLRDIYGNKKTDHELVALMKEGKFFPTDNETQWWIPSGRANYVDENNPAADTFIKAQARFLLPISYTDPYGAITKVAYETHQLFIQETTDVLGNRSGVERFNFRTLTPSKMKDINGNFSEVITDELGMVKAMAVMGKGDDADNLTGFAEITDVAETALVTSFFEAVDSVQLRAIGAKLLHLSTSRFVYNLDAYTQSGKPAMVAAIIREQHAKQKVDAPVQIAFEYSGGIGEVVMKKVQAEPGKGKQVLVQNDNSIQVREVDTAGSNPQQLRWIGNGKTIKNNKGNAVKQYEPYFSVNWHYEDYKELVETGVTPIMYYDAAGRLTKTEMPDGTFSKVEFNAWKHLSYDANDTVKDSAWYNKRIALPANDPARKAAEKAAAHYNTPSQLHMDTLGRPILQIEHNGWDENEKEVLYKTKIESDIEGNLRKVTDARELPENNLKGNMVMQYKYDMLGNMVYQNSMDAGQRWLLINILGKPLRTLDERNHEFQYFYDQAHRPDYSKVLGGDRKKTDGSNDPLDHIFERIIYGESLLTGKRDDANRQNEKTLQNRNVLGQVIQHYDTGGLVNTPDYDFKGQPLATTRKLFKKYKDVANWQEANLAADLEADDFIFVTETDALGRITKQLTPDKSIITPVYNEAGLLNGEKVSHFNLTTGTYDGNMDYIKDIDYNEKGQRNFIKYGNGVKTTFEYDAQTFRLRHLKSNLNTKILQDLIYTYDPVGNITSIRDDAYDPEFFSNRIIEPYNTYTYDALYRLKEATGRENAAPLSFGQQDNWNDAPFMRPNPMQVNTYIQSYQYDAVGNIEKMQHRAIGNDWTRKYEYQKLNNRLLSTFVGDIANAQNYTKYNHHATHGFITAMPHLDALGWNFKEELVKTIRQKRNDGGTPETTYYQYDGGGQRIRKITENQAAPGNTPTIKEERIYIAGYETYRTYQANSINFERESLSLLDGSHRFVMIETVVKNAEANPSPSERIGERLVRYQLHNHLGSASLELNEQAQIINYEEYHPYGTTAYQIKNAPIKATAKRYRYTGMERDEESGFSYHSARYYLPWLGRWLSTDPIGIGDGVNVYGYCRGNPIKLLDAKGKAGNCKSNTSCEETSFSFDDSNIQIQSGGKPQTPKVTMDIDEQEPVGQKGISDAEASRRATDVNNRLFRLSTENRITKHLSIETNPASVGSNQVSVTDDPNFLITKRFGEIKELADIFNQAFNSIKKSYNKATELKAAINEKIWEIIKTGKGDSAVKIREAFKSLGFENIKGQGYVLSGGASNSAPSNKNEVEEDPDVKLAQYGLIKPNSGINTSGRDGGQSKIPKPKESKNHAFTTDELIIQAAFIGMVGFIVVQPLVSILGKEALEEGARTAIRIEVNSGIRVAEDAFPKLRIAEDMVKTEVELIQEGGIELLKNSLKK